MIHLAWAIQPSRDEAVTERINVEGSRRVFDAVARAGVGAWSTPPRSAPTAPARSSAASTSPGRSDGIPTSFYSRHKAAVETLLDAFELREPDVRVVRLRPGLIFKARGRERDPPPLRRSLPARLPGPEAADPADPAGTATALSGGPLARRRRGLPAGGGARCPTAPSTSPPSRKIGVEELCELLRRPQLAAAPCRGRCAPPPTSAGSYACSPARLAGSTSPWGAGDGYHAGARAARLGAGVRARSRRSAICCGGHTPRRGRRDPSPGSDGGRSPADARDGHRRPEAVTGGVLPISGMVFGFCVEGRGIQGPWRDRTSNLFQNRARFGSAARRIC